MEYLQSNARQTDLLSSLPVMEIQYSLHNMIKKKKKSSVPTKKEYVWK